MNTKKVVNMNNHNDLIPSLKDEVLDEINAGATSAIQIFRTLKRFGFISEKYDNENKIYADIKKIFKEEIIKSG